MIKPFRFLFVLFFVGGILLFPFSGVAAQDGGPNVFLPMVMGTAGQPPTSIPTGQITNIPHFNDSRSLNDYFNEMAVFWFGRVTPSENYTDIRLGYNNSELVVYTASIDRLIWYNPSSNKQNLEDWDAMTLTLQIDGATPAAPNGSSYRFVGEYFHWETQTADRFRAAFRGTGSGWTSEDISFTATPNWRGDAPNNNIEDKGWIMLFRIPFASLGLSGPPAQGTVWRLGVSAHDRDSSGGSSISASWPSSMDRNVPSTWGSLRFGMPAYTPPASSQPQTTTIRQGLNGAVVPDTDAGGGSTCGGAFNYHDYWGDVNHAGHGDFNVQNQRDISDWPCFSRYYVTFPLDQIPAGKVIRSARLVMHQFGGSLPEDAFPSYIQVFTVANDWSESTLTWNNGPQALENISGAWVGVLIGNPVWPGTAREWDVSRAAAQAYNSGQDLRLALYSADDEQHSGKYFITSDAGDWNAVARPTLIIEWGTP